MKTASIAGPIRLPAVDIGSGATTRQLGHLAVRSQHRVGGSLPLTKVQIFGRVADRVAEVSLSQTFVNSYAELVETVYIFPLSGGCSVSHFEMTSGGQTICAVLAEREEARDDYQQALERGESAAILEQERDDVARGHGADEHRGRQRLAAHTGRRDAPRLDVERLDALAVLERPREHR